MRGAGKGVPIVLMGVIRCFLSSFFVSVKCSMSSLGEEVDLKKGQAFDLPEAVHAGGRQSPQQLWDLVELTSFKKA